MCATPIISTLSAIILTAKAIRGSVIVLIVIPHLFHIALVFLSINSLASLLIVLVRSSIGCPVTLYTIYLVIFTSPFS